MSATRAIDGPARRLFDVGASLVLLALVSPVLALTALAVKLTSKGPALYHAERVGKGGRVFHMLKFRSMKVGADKAGPGITAVDDPRVTPLGRVLRASKLDELPQLVNVLKGEMTLIGPRAEAPSFVAHYTAEQKRLLEVRPGVTGPGQIYYGEAQQERVADLARAEEVYLGELLDAKLEIDLEYLANRSLLRDARILIGSAWVVASGLGRGLLAAARLRPMPIRRVESETPRGPDAAADRTPEDRQS